MVRWVLLRTLHSVVNETHEIETLLQSISRVFIDFHDLQRFIAALATCTNEQRVVPLAAHYV